MKLSKRADLVATGSWSVCWLGCLLVTTGSLLFSGCRHNAASSGQVSPPGDPSSTDTVVIAPVGTTAPLVVTSTSTSAPTAKPKEPDDRGRYQVTRKLPAQHGCKTDNECELSEFEPGQCCPHECVGASMYPGRRPWVEAVRELTKRRCANFNGSCPRLKCDFFGHLVVQCQSGRCERRVDR